MRDLYFLTKKIVTAFSKIFITKNKDAVYIKREYRMIIVKDHDLKEVFNVVLSRKKVYVLFSMVMVLLFTVVFLLFAYSPVKYLLPEYGSYQERKELILLKKKIDSLETQFSYNEQFIKQFQSYFTVKSEEEEKEIKKKKNKIMTDTKKDAVSVYTDLVLRSGLATHAPVRGCMIIKPYGFQLWENMQAILDRMFKNTGHTNAYFPLFIPKNFFSKEAAHIEGFAKECAVVTHYRLKNNPGTNEITVDPEAKLEEELIVRPTSETIIWNTYKDWIKSYRDLPVLINQWANVVRWEMRTRLFLRTSEFLWQEGHTAHATQKEAEAEAEQMLQIYADFVENYMAIPVVKGIKTANERFAGAEKTYCIEVMLQDGKALQAGTSHFLGQNFARAFGVTFMNRNNEREFVWATSWGVSTRLIGALIMAHSDEKGLIMPPKIAPIQVVVIPVYKGKKFETVINAKATELLGLLKEKGIRIVYDSNDYQRPGWKFAEYELKGVPLRVVIGEQDIAKNRLEIVRRDTLQKAHIPLENSVAEIIKLLDDIQKDMLERQKIFLQNRITLADTFTSFKQILDTKGGFVAAHWDGTTETELKIKELTKATIRCIPLENKKEVGKCLFTGRPSKGRVLFARAY